MGFDLLWLSGIRGLLFLKSLLPRTCETKPYGIKKLHVFNWFSSCLPVFIQLQILEYKTTVSVWKYADESRGNQAGSIGFLD